jgi:hypothetical protein
MCDLYRPWIQWLFVAGVALTGNYYMMDVINDVGHLRLNLIGLLVLRTVVFNVWGTDIVLQVPLDSVNPAERE